MSKDNLTPRRSYPGVMVSSTFDDIKDLRNTLLKVIGAQDLKAIGMETAPVIFDGSVVVSSRKMVSESSAFVLIVSHRYGTIPDSSQENPNRLSLTEFEYNEAQRQQLPTLVFIMGPDFRIKPAHHERNTENEEKLNAFRERLKANHTCIFFDNEDEFEKKAIRAIAELYRELDEISKIEQPAESSSRGLPVFQNTTDPNTVPIYYPINNRSRRDLAEFRFIEILRPILNDLKILLKVTDLALAFLSPRDGEIVPELDHEEYDKYDRVRVSLIQQSKRFRNHELSKAILIDAAGRIVFAHSTSIASYRTLRAIVKRAASGWAKWVDTDPSEQIDRWLTQPEREIACSFKYIPARDNRDVVGYLIPLPHSRRPNVQADPSVGEEVQKLFEERLLPVLRHLLLATVKTQVHEQNSRKPILNTILEAAVSLSGADWGCIKSSTLGAATSMNPENCELVQAVCVHNCPRFFQEGRLVNTEQLVAFAVRLDADMVLNLNEETRKSFQHPAAQMAVFLIRDEEQVIEPRLPISDVVGAIVIQHTAPSYLKDWEDVYGPFLQELAELTSRATRAAASRSLVSMLKNGIIGELPPSFNEKVAEVVNALAPGSEATWVLLRPEHDRLNVVRESQNELGGLKQVLKDLVGAGSHLDDQTKLGAFVCNSTMSLVLQTYHHKEGSNQVGRIGSEDFAKAYFHEAYKRVTENLMRDGLNKVVFDLGSPESWLAAEHDEHRKDRWISLVIGPVVSATGRPVGVVAALREVHDWGPRWDQKQLKDFDAELSELRDPLYASYLFSLRQ